MENTVRLKKSSEILPAAAGDLFHGVLHLANILIDHSFDNTAGADIVGICVADNAQQCGAVRNIDAFICFSAADRFFGKEKGVSRLFIADAWICFQIPQRFAEAGLADIKDFGSTGM